MSDAICRCGHPRSAHYVYCLNGRDQTRCKSCDPMAGAPEGNYAFEPDTYVAAMNRAADHDFEQAVCGARTAAGAVCQKPPRRGYTRCWSHGGVLPRGVG